MMHTQEADGGVVPCYIGKSETVGKASGVLSANLQRLATDTSKFGRWGDNYAYHIGDLSSIVLPGHNVTVQTEKYRSWATALFEGINTDHPRLRQPVFFFLLLGPSLEERGRRNLDGVWAHSTKLPRISSNRDRWLDISWGASEPRRPQPKPIEV